MNPTSDERSQPLDDDTIADLIRTTAADWTMPPQRIDQPSRRDRAERRARYGWGTRMPRSGGWLRRVSAAFSAAILGSVVLALLGIYLTMPHPPQAGKLPTPSASGSPIAGESPGPSQLPEYALFGAPLSGRLIVSTDAGLATVDLGTGKLGQTLTGEYDRASTLVGRPGGGFICLCLKSTPGSGISMRLDVTVRVIGGDGSVSREFGIGPYRGEIDVVRPNLEQGPPANVSGALDSTGRLLYLMWAGRQGAVWKQGVDVVDLSTRKTVQSVALPDYPSSDYAGSVDVDHGRLYFDPSGTHAMVSFDASSNSGPAPGSHVVFAVRAGRLGAAQTLRDGDGTLSDASCGRLDEGFASDSVYFEVCAGTKRLFLRRASVDGRPLGDSDLGPNGDAFEGSGGVDRATGVYYAWDPYHRTLIKVSLTTGKVTGPTAPAPTAMSGQPLDVLAAAGRWLGNRLVPPVAAKVFLQPGVALSPDGSRLYALGIKGTSEEAGSAGIFVWDTVTMRPLANWAPTADLVSVAVSPDGQFVYAAGAPGWGPNGPWEGVPASVTVYQAADGHVRLIAGRLGPQFLTFASLGG